ncbi:MAG: dienelactone hydrolase family protein [Pseudobdellovibrionaceae bacterium]
MRLFGVLILVFLIPLFAEAKVVEKTVEYKQGDKTYEGFMAYPEKAGTYPGVLVIHDWMGISDGTKEKVRAVADLGYLAFAADIYGKGVRPGYFSAALANAVRLVYE